MPFPSPSLVAPSLSNYQMQYKGVTFGGVVQTDTYQMQSIMGVDAPDADSGDAQRPLDQGEFIGIDVTKGRDITIQQVVRAATATALDTARQTLGGVLGAAGNTESPLYLKLPSGLYACMARPRKHAFPIDINAVFAKGVVASTLFHATDPRWYAAPTKSASVARPAAATGNFTFNATPPFTFGAGAGAAGVLSVTNAGQFEMRPILIFTGPLNFPAASNLSIAGAPSLQTLATLGVGDQLVLDTDFQTVTLFTAGSTVGVSRRDLLNVGGAFPSTWWNLPPGVNQIALTAVDSTPSVGTLTVQSADAWMSL